MISKVPQPTWIMHFTHVSHVPTIATDGLLSDTAARQSGNLVMDVGNQEIKAQRRHRSVPVQPGGVVADYAPFYFAPRSPMMSAIANGQVPHYRDGCSDLVYLVSSVQRVRDLGLSVVFTDRNAVLRLATYSNNPTDLEIMIDWSLMKARYWFNTDAEPDRRERRMAECLVHDRVPWEAVLGLAVRTAQQRDLLSLWGISAPIAVRPTWYF